jgi:hypothetical protein
MIIPTRLLIRGEVSAFGCRSRPVGDSRGGLAALVSLSSGCATGNLHLLSFFPEPKTSRALSNSRSTM